MVSLTLMLVIATITASIQTVSESTRGSSIEESIFQTLPATPYFKMIDIWLFFSMNLMVISLIFHTYLQYVVKKEKKDLEKDL